MKTTMDNIHQLEEKLTEASNELNRVKETILACEEKIAEASILKHKVGFLMLRLARIFVTQ